MKGAEDKLVDEICGHLSALKAEMTPAGSAKAARVMLRARALRQYQDKSRQKAVDEWLGPMVRQVEMGLSGFDEPLRDIAAYLIVRGEPLPPPLRRYVRKLLQAPVAKKRKRGSPGGRNMVRDTQIVINVDYLVECHNMKPTIACSIVAKALRKAGINVSKHAVVKIWGTQKPVDGSAKVRSYV